ncbi:NAD(P)/FAD-dependent oxidoreductase [Labrys monachus]|uniref:Glycine/D-amino acid oxidase-like deaminating enzyme n=1 Tax=Labrys monachus TaxID=217067 RepID=A0ABU0F7Y9_9HYPH|nr:FAD-dependent oxidoreductase [Labrys monachus]MDQ0390482.1 glycine/D-amino acid oxidase-like deaminating enzyme [Labrys monachus]
MAGETFDASLWSALTPPLAAAAPLAGHETADVLVIGAGFLGLSTALHLAEAGIGVTVLEADEPGFGASGRNTGFVVPSLKPTLGSTDGTTRLSEAEARLTDLVGRSGDILFDLIRRHRIDCSAEQTGWLQPAHTAAAFVALQQRRAEWESRGRVVEILDAAETSRRTGMSGYHGALFDPTGGQINPLAYARGLAAAGRRAGVVFHHRSRVEKLERSDGKWIAHTQRGRVEADRVVLTTNALVGQLAPAVHDSIIPVRVHQVATQPLPPELQRIILPQRSPAADTRRHTFAVRWSPDGRLMTGGLVLPGPSSIRRAEAYFIRRLERFLPRAVPLRAAFAWNGVIAATPDSLPRFFALEPGLDAVIGCNGRGIALTTVLGRELAALYAGQRLPGEFALPHTAPRAIPARRLAGYAPAFWLPWSNLRDRLESGR